MIDFISISIKTEPSGPPVNIQYFPVDKDSFKFTWGDPACGNRNGIIQYYSYSLILGNDELTNDMTEYENVTIDGLLGCSVYAFTVGASIAVGAGLHGLITVATDGTGIYCFQ